MHKNVSKQVFQHKIGVNLTPTKEYLHRYQVVDSSRCDRCEDGETDTIIHCLWECSKIQPFLQQILQNITDWTNRQEGISMLDFLFGLEENGCDPKANAHHKDAPACGRLCPNNGCTFEMLFEC